MKAKKRVRPRGDVSLTIKYLGDATNISEGGMGVIIDDPLPLGHKVELGLLLPDSSDNNKQKSSNSIKLEGEVAWTKYSETLDRHEIGIKFAHIQGHNKERLKSFIEKHAQDNSQQG